MSDMAVHKRISRSLLSSTLGLHCSSSQSVRSRRGKTFFHSCPVLRLYSVTRAITLTRSDEMIADSLARSPDICVLCSALLSVGAGESQGVVSASRWLTVSHLVRSTRAGFLRQESSVPRGYASPASFSCSVTGMGEQKIYTFQPR